MLLKAPRWVLICEAVLVLLALAALFYLAMTKGLFLGRVEPVRLPQPDPHTQVREYYRDFPERYLRISKESWRYDQGSRAARHSFTLRNTATVGYRGIRVAFRYQSTGGKTLQTETVEIPGALAALQTREITNLRVNNVPADSDTVVASVVGAEVSR